MGTSHRQARYALVGRVQESLKAVLRPDGYGSSGKGAPPHWNTATGLVERLTTRRLRGVGGKFATAVERTPIWRRVQ